MSLSLALSIAFLTPLATSLGSDTVYAGHLQDDVACLEALVGRVALGSDLGDDDAILARARNLHGGGKREPEIVELLGGGVGGLLLLERGELLAARELAELEAHLVLLTVADDGELHVGIGMQLGDLAGEIARIVDLLAVHRDDHIAGLRRPSWRRVRPRPPW